MSLRPPLIRQEKDNTCGLACLRMVLAAYEVHVDECVLESHANMEVGGVLIAEVERLARRWHLQADIRETSTDDLREILENDRLAIAFIDRRIFELTREQWALHSIRDAIIHTVVPIRITSRTVTYHDPRLSHTVRKSISEFERAHQGIGGYSVVCSKPRSSTAL